MKTLVILTGLSCTLKDSVSNELIEYGFIKFPDVNRDYINTLTSIVDVPESVNVTSKIPNIMLCSNRLTVYNTFLDGFYSCPSVDQSEFFVMQRTVLEHLFFDNQDMLSTVNKDKLINAEKEFLSRFDKVVLVLLVNKNKTMLEKYYLTDNIRTSITKKENKLEAYYNMQEPYGRFISQLKDIDLKIVIEDNFEPNSDNLISTTSDISNKLIEYLKINK